MTQQAQHGQRVLDPEVVCPRGLTGPRDRRPTSGRDSRGPGEVTSAGVGTRQVSGWSRLLCQGTPSGSRLRESQRPQSWRSTKEGRADSQQSMDQARDGELC